MDNVELIELPFDQYQRYKIVQDLVTLIRGDRSLRVLDVGGHPGFIWDFLPNDEAFVLDIVPWTKANYVQGHGAALPFANESFDLVLSVDTLEHIPPAQRELVLAEQLRITRDYLLVVAPFADDNVDLTERIIHEFFVKRLGYHSSFLQEHLTYGLPDLGGVLNYLDENRIQHLEAPNGYLYNWLVMMLVLPLIQAIPDSQDLYRMINRLYNSNFYEGDNRRPCYRTAVLASKRHSLDVIAILHKYKREVEGKSDGNLKIQLANLLLNLKVEEPRITALEDELRQRDQRVIRLQKEFEERTEWALRLEEEVRQRDQYITQLQKEFEERTQWALQLEKEVRQRDQHITQLQSEFEERTDWALRLERRVQEQDQYIEQLQKEFEEQAIWASKVHEELMRIKQTWYYRLFDEGPVKVQALFRQGAKGGTNEDNSHRSDRTTGE